MFSRFYRNRLPLLKFTSIISLLLCASCVFVPGNSKYAGPVERPESLDAYYSRGSGYSDVKEEVVREETDFAVKKITLSTELGPVVLDYYARHQENDAVIFVFPMLGGKNLFEKYFAQYFAQRGYDTAIVNRNGEFKKPENFLRLEEILRQGVVRDRIALDFLQERYHKKEFASFGISRGAINAAMTAGVDARLKYNVLLMGGSHLAELFRDSNQPGITKYKNKVMAQNNITPAQLHFFLQENIKTDPKIVAPYIDPKNTLMILSAFDRTVPFRYGMKLRRYIGRPDTVFLPTDHYLSLLYTGFATSFAPGDVLSALPIDLVETEALAFYDRHLNQKHFRLKQIPLEILQLPLRAIGALYNLISEESTSASEEQE